MLKHAQQAAHVLIIEEEEQLRSVLRKIFEGDGLFVETAPDSAQGFRALKLLEPHLVFVDLDGAHCRELCEKKSRDDSIKYVPTFGLTDDLADIIDPPHGVMAVINKPPSVDGLLALASRFCRR